MSPYAASSRSSSFAGGVTNSGVGGVATLVAGGDGGVGGALAEAP